MRRAGGFTLLEVLLAVFFVALLMGGLVAASTQTIRDLSRSRDRIEANRLAEQRARALMAEMRSGVLPDMGTTEGSFEEPDEYLRWQQVVESYTVPRVDSVSEDTPSSTIFAEPSTAPGAPQPSVRRVTLRVFQDGFEPESGDAFVLFGVEALPANLAAAVSAPENEAVEAAR
jgi:type II secretory pathway pseudopilin PulG